MADEGNTFDLDSLLAQAGWLRALARSLVGDSAFADDLSQQTWLAALAKRPASAGNLRGWLARTLHNALRQELRSRRHREGREQGRDLRPSGDSGELIQRVEAQRLLAAEVLRLPDPYRSTLLRHYYEGLSAAEIARRDGVPAGTVRWRLHAALGELRARLEGLEGREAWSALLMPLASGSASTRSPLAAGGGIACGIAGGLAMGIKTVLACATLALLAGVAYVAWHDTERPPDLLATSMPEAARLEILEPGGQQDTGSGMDLLSSEIATDRIALPATFEGREPSSVRVRARLPDGAPVAGVLVALLPYGEDDPVLAHAKTDAEGWARLATQAGLTRARIVWSAAGLSTGSRDVDDLSGEVELQLEWLASLTGVVRDAQTGEPLEDVEIGERGPLTTDDGRYHLSDLSVGHRGALLVRRAGYVDQVATYLLGEPGEGVLDIALERGYPLVLHVYDRVNGLPLEGATLARRKGSPPFDHTNAEGLATLRIGVGSELALLVSATGYCSVKWIWSVQAPPSRSEVLVPLVREALIEGQVVDDQGLPVAEAWLSARCEEDQAGMHTFSHEEQRELGLYGYGGYQGASGVEAGVNGEFRLPVLPCGHLQTVIVSHASCPQLSVPLAAPMFPGESRRMDVRLERGGTIRGRALENGQPLPEVMVTWRNPHGAHGESNSADVEKGGTYELVNIPPGSIHLQLVFTASRIVLDEAFVDLEAGEVVEHDFERTLAFGEIRGRVTAGSDPLAGIEIGACASSGLGLPQREFHTQTDADGNFRLSVPEGMDFQVSALRSPDGATRAHVPAGATDVDFDLLALGTLRLRLVDSAGGTPARLERSRVYGLWWRRSGEDDLHEARPDIDLDGRQDLTVPSGLVDVLVHLQEDGYAPRLVEGVRVAADGASDIVTVPLERGLQARLAFAGEGAPPEGLLDHLVFLVEEGQLDQIEGPYPDQSGRSNTRINGICMRLGNPTLRAQLVKVGLDGAALVQGLAPGRYHLRAYPDDFVFEPGAFDLPAAEEGPIRIGWRRR